VRAEQSAKSRFRTIQTPAKDSRISLWQPVSCDRVGFAGGLPVQFATRFPFVVNLKAAKAIDLAVPTSALLRASEVIE
jgi:hypothetical protein